MTIERAAKAIWLSRVGAMDKTDARILARAALEAIAEPTPAMIEAGYPYAPEEADDCWRAMHAAMIKETK